MSDVNILENVNFKKVKELNLYDNKISDIKVLEKVKFEKLELLDLGENKLFIIEEYIFSSILFPLKSNISNFSNFTFSNTFISDILLYNKYNSLIL